MSLDGVGRDGHTPLTAGSSARKLDRNIGLACPMSLGVIAAKPLKQAVLLPQRDVVFSPYSGAAPDSYVVVSQKYLLPQEQYVAGRENLVRAFAKLKLLEEILEMILVRPVSGAAQFAAMRQHFYILSLHILSHCVTMAHMQLKCSIERR